MAQNIFYKLESKVKQKDLLTPKDLSDSGLFGSESAVRALLRSGAIPSIRISKNRTLIDRDDVMHYLQSCLTPK